MAQADPSTIKELLDALVLPPESRIDQRVPKKLLLEQGAPTTADKRLINECIEEIQWLAALKPNTIGVSAYSDDQREYLEIAVVGLVLRGLEGKPAQVQRLAMRLHRAVPYPMLLLVQNGPELLLTLAHKRWAQNEADKVVLEGEMTTASLQQLQDRPQAISGFMHCLALHRQPQRHLKELYQGWSESCDALNAAALTGTFRIAAGPEQAAARRHALKECERLEAEVRRLRSQARKEKQLVRQVELNLALKNLQAELREQRANL